MNVPIYAEFKAKVMDLLSDAFDPVGELVVIRHDPTGGCISVPERPAILADHAQLSLLNCETEGSTYVDVDILIACVGESERDELVGSIHDLSFVDVCERAFLSDTVRGVASQYTYRSDMRSKSSN